MFYFPQHRLQRVSVLLLVVLVVWAMSSEEARTRMRTRSFKRNNNNPCFLKTFLSASILLSTAFSYRRGLSNFKEGYWVSSFEIDLLMNICRQLPILNELQKTLTHGPEPWIFLWLVSLQIIVVTPHDFVMNYLSWNCVIFFLDQAEMILDARGPGLRQKLLNDWSFDWF